MKTLKTLQNHICYLFKLLSFLFAFKLLNYLFLLYSNLLAFSEIIFQFFVLYLYYSHLIYLLLQLSCQSFVMFHLFL